MNDTIQKIQPRCPFCAHADGRLYAVKYNRDIKTLTFRCEVCVRSWEAEEYSASMETPRQIPEHHNQH